MRVEKPIKLLTERGYTCTTSDEARSDVDINVFQKHNNVTYDRSMMDLLNGITVRIFDICDDHFDTDVFSDHYTCMSQQADIVTANSPNLIMRTLEKTGRTAMYIKDPITFPERFPVLPKENPSVVWYGSHTNFKPMGEIIHKIKEPVTVICNAPLKGADHVNFIPWGLGVVEEEIKNHDIVVIPLGNLPEKQNKNTNRAVDALMAGKFVVTDSEKVYGELKNFIFIGDILDGIFWCKHNRIAAYDMVRAGQEYVKKNYSDLVVGDQWEDAIKESLKFFKAGVVGFTSVI
jgi:hypothetical protein